MKVVEVAALILEDERQHVLIGQRRVGDSNEGKWEFPGGKKQDGESLEQALIREIREELGIEVSGFEFFDHVAYAYPLIHVEVTFFHLQLGGRIDCTMNAHADIQWVPRGKLTDFDFLEANQVILSRLCPDQDLKCS